MKTFGLNIGYYGMRIINLVLVTVAAIATYIGNRAVDLENYFGKQLGKEPSASVSQAVK